MGFAVARSELGMPYATFAHSFSFCLSRFEGGEDSSKKPVFHLKQKKQVYSYRI